MPGKVYLVGAGPGDPELLTLKAVACIKEADLILYDYLIEERTLQYAKKNAELVSLGDHHSGRKISQQEINQRMVNGALAGKTVVRLKGGDPHIFGRLNEEIRALSFEAGINFEIVPGITSALAAAQAAGISLTDRHYADTGALALVSGHRPHDPLLPAPDFKKYATFPGTLVFYMGIFSATHWSTELIEGGKSPDTPVVFVFNATMPDQRIIRSTLGKIKETIQNENLQSPCIVIVGQTVRVHEAINF